MKYCTKKSYCGQRSAGSEDGEAVIFCEAGRDYRCPFMTNEIVYAESYNLDLDKVC